MMTRRRVFRGDPRGALVVAAALTLCAQTPAMGVTFSACKNNHSGKVRPGSITTGAATCKSKETSVSWNSEGLAGATGATGAMGPTGPKGSAGGTGPQKLVIAGSAFQSDGGGDDANFYFYFSTGRLQPMGTGACMLAAAPLPAGATITGFEAHMIDNDASDLTINFTRVSNLTGVKEDIASVVSTGASTSIQNLTTTTITAGTTTVDTDHSYYVTFCFGSGTAAFNIYAVGVSYTS